MNRLPHRSGGRFGRLVSRVRHLLADERGDAMQWIMGLCVAGLIIVALYTFGQTLIQTVQDYIDQISGGGGGGG